MRSGCCGREGSKRRPRGWNWGKERMKICVNVCNMSLCLVLFLDLQLPPVSRVYQPPHITVFKLVRGGSEEATGFAKSQHRGTVIVKLHCQLM